MPLRSWLRRLRTPPTVPSGRRSAPSPPRDLRERPLSDAGLATFSADMLCPPSAPVQVFPGLFSVSLLTDATVQRLQAELQAAQDWCAREGVAPPPPNSMHEAGMMLELLGLVPWAEALVRDRLAPLAATLFPDHTQGPPPTLHAFSVDYGPMGDRRLAQHVDDAAVTANLWLGGDAEGSAVVFEGLRCLSHLDVAPRMEEIFAWKGQPGEVLLHAGLHRHRTEAVGQGQRGSLIFWMQDPTVRARIFDDGEHGRCPAWCGA